MSEVNIDQLYKERNWWSTLAERYGMKLYGWSGMPPNCSATWIMPSGKTVEIPGELAEVLFRVGTP